MSFNLPINKNNASYANETKNSSPFSLYLRHGKDPSMGDLADYTFLSVVFPDGTILGDLTFQQLADIVWTNINKS